MYTNNSWKTHFYQLKICLEARARVRVCVCERFFFAIVVHMIQFDLSELDISVHVLRLISVWMILDDATPCARIPNNEIRSWMPTMRKKKWHNLWVVTFVRQIWTLLYKLCLLQQKMTALYLCGSRIRNQNRYLKIFSWSATRIFNRLIFKTPYHVKEDETQREQFTINQNCNVILYETGIKYQLALCSYHEKRNPRTCESQQNRTIIKKEINEKRTKSRCFGRIVIW